MALNFDLKQLNLYNGTMLTNNGTPFITEEYRRNIKSGVYNKKLPAAA